MEISHSFPAQVGAAAALGALEGSLDALGGGGRVGRSLARRAAAARAATEARLRELLGAALTASDRDIAARPAAGLVCGRLVEAPLTLPELLGACESLGGAAGARLAEECAGRVAAFAEAAVAVGSRERLVRRSGPGGAVVLAWDDGDANEENATAEALAVGRGAAVLAFVADACPGAARGALDARVADAVVLPRLVAALGAADDAPASLRAAARPPWFLAAD